MHEGLKGQSCAGSAARDPHGIKQITVGPPHGIKQITMFILFSARPHHKATDLCVDVFKENNGLESR
ncbi:hypothetical protein J6590_035800 [Homalodisca vitripennis]|nr:hypothetical protein J6590_035800 [Homalodisca vitripennis]